MFGRLKRKDTKTVSAPAALNDVSSEDDKDLAAEIANGEEAEARRLKANKEPEYNFEDLWRDLKDCLDNADAYYGANYKNPNDPDDAQLKITYDAIKETYRLGKIAEAISLKHIKAKALAGKDAQDVFFKTFGESRMAPIVGKKSQRIVEIAVLPFLLNAAKIYNPWYMPLACKFLRKFAKVEIDLEKEKAAAAKMALDYQAIIAKRKAAEEAEEQAQEAVLANGQQNQEHRSPSPIRK